MCVGLWCVMWCEGSRAPGCLHTTSHTTDQHTSRWSRTRHTLAYIYWSQTYAQVTGKTEGKINVLPPKSIHSENLKKDCPEGSYLISSHRFWYSGELKINMVSSIWPKGFAWKSLELIPREAKILDLVEISCTPLRVHTFSKLKSVITRHIFELRIFWPAPQAGNFEFYNFEKIQMGSKIQHFCPNNFVRACRNEFPAHCSKLVPLLFGAITHGITPWDE